MSDVELILMFLAYAIIPPAIKLTSRRLDGTSGVFVFWLSAVSFAVCGYFLTSFFLSRVAGVQGDVLTLYSLLAGIILAFPYWKLVCWAESRRKIEDESRSDLLGRFVAGMTQPISQLSQRVDQLESAVGQTSRKIGRLQDASDRTEGSVADAHQKLSSFYEWTERNLSNMAAYLEKYQTALQGIHSEISEGFKDLKDSQNAVPQQSVYDGAPETPPEKPVLAPKKLTTEDGRRARFSGGEWQKRLVEFIRGLIDKLGPDLEVEESPEKGKPDLVIRTHGKVRAIGACKAYTLWPFQPNAHRTSQRTVLPSMIVVEKKSALKHKVPLFIAVVNQRTGIPWFHIVPQKELDSFERVTTPSWLAEDEPPQEEVERNHREFIEFLKGLV
jgi:hypothetical protein